MGHYRIRGPGVGYASLFVRRRPTHWRLDWHPEVPFPEDAYWAAFEARSGELLVLWNRLRARGVFAGELKPDSYGYWMMCPAEVAEMAEAIVREASAAGLAAHAAARARDRALGIG